MAGWFKGAGALVIAGLAGQVMATTVLPVNLAQMSESAEAAFVVRVDSVDTISSGTGSFDQISGIVTEPVFGAVATSESVSWKQMRVSKAMAIAGMPEYTTGTEYLIFLSGRGRGTGFQAPMGLQQGAFRVIRNPATGGAMVRNELGNMSLAAGLNMTSVAQTMAQREAFGNRLRGGASMEERAAEISGKLRPMRAGNSLDAVRDAARFFREEKARGRRPSRDFGVTTGSAAIRRPLQL